MILKNAREKEILWVKTRWPSWPTNWVYNAKGMEGRRSFGRRKTRNSQLSVPGPTGLFYFLANDPVSGPVRNFRNCYGIRANPPSLFWTIERRKFYRLFWAGIFHSRSWKRWAINSTSLSLFFSSWNLSNLLERENLNRSVTNDVLEGFEPRKSSLRWRKSRAFLSLDGYIQLVVLAATQQYARPSVILFMRS